MEEVGGGAEACENEREGMLKRLNSRAHTTRREIHSDRIGRTANSAIGHVKAQTNADLRETTSSLIQGSASFSLPQSESAHRDLVKLDVDELVLRPAREARDALRLHLGGGADVDEGGVRLRGGRRGRDQEMEAGEACSLPATRRGAAATRL